MRYTIIIKAEDTGSDLIDSNIICIPLDVEISNDFIMATYANTSITASNRILQEINLTQRKAEIIDLLKKETTQA
jgi:hypothetical protein